MTRRHFVTSLAGVGASVVGVAVVRGSSAWSQGARGVHFSVAEFDRARILRAADDAMRRAPLKLADVAAPGGRNPQAFYSERAARRDDDEKDGIGPSFMGHVDLLVAMAGSFSALVAAWRLTGASRYFDAARRQALVWFVEPANRMLPTLEHAGVVLGVDDDRNNGLTGTVALAECARTAAFLCASPLLPQAEGTALRQWFAAVLAWLVDSKKGNIARQSKSLDSICWTMQAAEFSRFTRDDAVYRTCAHLFRDGLLRQMNFDGYFPAALHDDNPYSTSMFTLECMAAACESLSTPFESLWPVNLPDGRGMHSAVAWALPFLRDRGKWPYVSDRENFKAQPIRANALLFAGRAYDQPDYVDVWKALPPDPPNAVMARAHPIPQPALWAVRPPA